MKLKKILLGTLTAVAGLTALVACDDNDGKKNNNATTTALTTTKANSTTSVNTATAGMTTTRIPGQDFTVEKTDVLENAVTSLFTNTHLIEIKNVEMIIPQEGLNELTISNTRVFVDLNDETPTVVFDIDAFANQDAEVVTNNYKATVVYKGDVGYVKTSIDSTFKKLEGTPVESDTGYAEEYNITQLNVLAETAKTIAESIEQYKEAAAEVIATIPASLIEVFTLTPTADGYTLSLNTELINDTVEGLKTILFNETISELFDSAFEAYLGADAYKSLFGGLGATEYLSDQANFEVIIQFLKVSDVLVIANTACEEYFGELELEATDENPYPYLAMVLESADEEAEFMYQALVEGQEMTILEFATAMMSGEEEALDAEMVSQILYNMIFAEGTGIAYCTPIAAILMYTVFNEEATLDDLDVMIDTVKNQLSYTSAIVNSINANIVTDIEGNVKSFNLIFDEMGKDKETGDLFFEGLFADLDIAIVENADYDYTAIMDELKACHDLTQKALSIVDLDALSKEASYSSVQYVLHRDLENNITLDVIYADPSSEPMLGLELESVSYDFLCDSLRFSFDFVVRGFEFYTNLDATAEVTETEAKHDYVSTKITKDGYKYEIEHCSKCEEYSISIDKEKEYE